MFLQLFTPLALFTIIAEARKWNNTGVGSVIFEEAVSLPNLRPSAGNPPPGTYPSMCDACI